MKSATPLEFQNTRILGVSSARCCHPEPTEAVILPSVQAHAILRLHNLSSQLRGEQTETPDRSGCL
jgi:hypothetical protein